MSQNGWEKWWWHDWLTDSDLQLAAASSRGIWVNLLGHMWAKRTFELTLTTPQFCRLGGCSEAEFEAFLDDARNLGFCDISVTGSVTVTVVSRRRKRTDKTRQNNRLRKRRQRCHADVTLTETEAEAEAEEREEKDPPSVSSPRCDLRFAEWWSAYPKKTGKKPCLAIWKRRKLDSQADRLVNDTIARATTDVQWLNGFIPNPQTYLNQDRWEDEIQTTRSNGKQQRPMTKDDYVAEQQRRMDDRANGEILEGDGKPVWPALVR